MPKCYKCKTEKKLLHSTSESKISPTKSVALCKECYKEETRKEL